jgi:uncharacterized protein YcbX
VDLESVHQRYGFLRPSAQAPDGKFWLKWLRRDGLPGIDLVMPSIAALYRYPVKSLSAERLDRSEVHAGRTLPGDRRFAIAPGSSRYDAAQPAWQPKASFLTMVANPRLARLKTTFDDATDILSIARDGREVARGKLTDPIGRAVIEQFLAAYMAEEARGRTTIAVGPGVTFTDKAEPYISLIGLASVRDLERVARAPVDPVRFRANIYVEDAAPWAEFGWVGKEIAINGVRFRVEQRITRCAATELNPADGKRDLTVLASLRSGFGHMQMGVYARALNDGTIAIGDKLNDVAVGDALSPD